MQTPGRLPTERREVYFRGRAEDPACMLRCVEGQRGSPALALSLPLLPALLIYSVSILRNFGSYNARYVNWAFGRAVREATGQESLVQCRQPAVSSCPIALVPVAYRNGFGTRQAPY